MIVVLLSNGDRAEADCPEGAVLAARTLMDEAERHGAASRLLTASFYVGGRLIRHGVRRDHVLIADAVLRRLDPSYVAPAFDPMPFEVIADEVNKQDEALPEIRAVAIYLAARLYGLDAPTPLDEAGLDELAEGIEKLAPEERPR